MAEYNDGIKLTTSISAEYGNKNSGGSSRTASDHPFVKGYFYVFFGLPTQIFNGSDDRSDINVAKDFLLVSAEAFTPPGDRTLNMQDIQGQGGVDASFITGQTITRDFSIQYKDYWGAPIFRIHRQWTQYLDPYLGASTIADDFSAAEYKGICMVIQTKPIARNVDGDSKAFKLEDIIKVDLFDGVMPTTDLKSAYDANITDNSFVKPNVSYKFDGFPKDETNLDVKQKALDVLNAKKLFDGTANMYNKLINEDNIPTG